jgi:hypothetical protein
MMDCLNILSSVKLNTEAARRAPSNDDTSAISVFGMSFEPKRTHANAITERKRQCGFKHLV